MIGGGEKLTIRRAFCQHGQISLTYGMSRWSIAVAVAGALIVFGACRSDSTSPDKATAIVIAHRGASFDAPEHTTAAFDLAVSQHADYMELDIARSSDNALVVIHDATLERTMRGSPPDCAGGVASRTIAQMRTCDAGAWFNALYPSRASQAFSGLRIQTVAEVIDRYPGTRLYIEIKNPELYPGIESDLLALLSARGLIGTSGDGLPRVFVQSFSRASLEKVRAINPEIPLIFLVPDIEGVESLVTDVAGFANGIGVPVSRTTRALVDRAHQSDILVHAYVSNDEQEMQSLLGLGVDGIFTDRPGVLVGVLVDDSP